MSLDQTHFEASVLQDLASMSYESVAARHQTSRGRVYNIALKHGARKNEARIAEREKERRARRESFLREVVNASCKADVLEFLDGIPNGCVSLHCTSIPYNVGKSYGGTKESDSRPFHYYLGWMLQVLSEFERTLKPGGVLFLQVGATRGPEGGLYPLDCLLFEHLRCMGLEFQSRVVWEVQHGLTPRARLAERHETALVFSKGPITTFNATPARIPQKQPGKRAFKGPNRGDISSHPLGAWPTNVWKIPNVGHNHTERTGHPAQFPEALARRAVLLYTLPEDLVLDAFCGSGTVHAVCRRTGRAFTGADLFYEDLRAKRLAAVDPDLVSWLPGVTDESLAVWQAEARRVDLPPVATGAQLRREIEQMTLEYPDLVS